MIRVVSISIISAPKPAIFPPKSILHSSYSSLFALTTRPLRQSSNLMNGTMDRSRIPYLAQDPGEVKSVLTAMQNNHGNSRGRFRKKNYKVSDNSGRTVDSWSLNDWDYKKHHLPTYARGLFTHSNNGKPEIAIRGYDKFFNVDEVRKTEWRNIETNTRGPYELSVKENGCIIFIGGLDDKTLLVTSKHSTGPRDDDSANHALVGERWIDKQLADMGKTRVDLAKTLRSMNATAVAELCDDDFEEHVLQYTPEQAGLYLHGINLNLPEFATYPGDQVAKFADEWGFKKVQYVMMDNIEEVKPFLEKTAETGHYNGRDTEGFVIRCQARDSPNASWHDWFFKFKFEEPYLMYRQWREVTKSIIAGKAPKYNKHKQITSEYITYARRQLAKDSKLGEQFNQNHGIIAMRDGFLAEKGLKGSEIIQSELAQGGDADEDGSTVSRNVVLVPAATIGCGKTTVATALTKLFGWGHEQNDNIVGKQGRPKRFVTAITMSMASHPVVIADRNNHQRRERQQIIDDVKSIVPDATLVALHYVHDRGNYGAIRKAMQDRVLARGNNHQTIQAGSKGQSEITGIMDGFLQRFEPVDIGRRPDSDFDLVIPLEVTANSRQNLEAVVKHLHDQYPKLVEMPTNEDMDNAIDFALNYKPDIHHDLSRGSKENKGAKKGKSRDNTPGENGHSKRPDRIEYFSINLPTQRVQAILDAVFSSSEPPETTRFYNQLKASRRIQPAFHVTLIHKASIPQHGEYWTQLTDLWKRKSESAEDKALIAGTDGGVEMGKARVQLERVVWDDRVMAIVARLPDVNESGNTEDLVPGGFRSVNSVAHVTVGTASDNIKPKESNDLLKKWLEGDDSQRIKEIKVRGNVVLDGSIRGIISR